MNRAILSLAAALAVLPSLAIGTHAQNPAGVLVGPPLTASQRQPLILPGKPHRGRITALPSKDKLDRVRMMKRAAASKIIPLWKGSFKYGKQSYPVFMVGAYPFTKQAKPSTSIPTVIIPVEFIFTPQNVVFDPTQVDAECSPKFTPLNLAKSSPAFASRSMTIGGTNLGTGQFADLFQRANFWDFVKPKAINAGYHVSLNPVTVAPTLKVVAQNYSVEYAPCGKLGMIKQSDWDDYIRALIPKMKATITPTTFPIFLFYNVVLYDKDVTDCCIGGYHSWFNNSAFGGVEQTYGSSVYITNDALTDFADASVLVHEIAEWMDDPFVNNSTPSWGNIGQISGCSSVLEVGDPLTSTHKTISYNGLTYHVQDLAFVPWFYKAKSVDSFSLKKGYSLYGTLKTAAAACP